LAVKGLKSQKKAPPPTISGPLCLSQVLPAQKSSLLRK